MKITVLVNDLADPGLTASHGLSFWIETTAGSVLFDTGQSPAFDDNVQQIAIPLEAARAIVLSHGHYDHANGLPYALSRNISAPIYLHPDARRTRYSIRNRIPKSIGMSPAARVALNAAKGRRVWTKGPVEVLKGVHATGLIPRQTPFEDTGGPFFLDTDGRKPDPIVDDQALWIETATGMVVVLGCAHSGVVNTLEYICALSGCSNIQAVIGGMHLASASPCRLNETVKAFECRSVQQVIPCHCTGETATRYLRDYLPGRVQECTAGRIFEFPDYSKSDIHNKQRVNP